MTEIAGFEIVFGTEGRDRFAFFSNPPEITRDTVILGLGGDDLFAALPSDGAIVHVGGAGSDTYTLPSGEPAIVLNRGGGGGALEVPFGTVVRLWTYGEHLVLEPSGLRPIIVWRWLDPDLELGRMSFIGILDDGVTEPLDFRPASALLDTAARRGGLAELSPSAADLLVPGLDALLARVAELDAALVAGALDGPATGLTVEEARRVALLYESALDRDGAIDLDGLNFWIDAREDGLSETGLAAFFLGSGEFRAAFGDVSTLPDRALVELLYRNVLDREGEEAGVGFWTGALADPGYGRDRLLLDFSVSVENAETLTLLDTLAEIAPGEWAFA